MKTINYLVIILCICFSCKKPTSSDNKDDISKTPQLSSIDTFFPEEKTKVLVVGTFHFNYPGLDTHKIDETNKIDVLKEPKKSEVTELVNYIKRFKPTKIAIEALEGYGWNTKYKEYQNGEHRQKRDERFQLAMRIAMDLQLDTLYPIDARTLSNDLWKSDSLFYDSLTSKIDWEVKDPYWDKAVKYLDNETVARAYLNWIHFVSFFYGTSTTPHFSR